MSKKKSREYPSCCYGRPFAVSVLFDQELAYQKALIDGKDWIPNLDWQEVINRKLTNPKERMWIAELDGNLVGYVMVRLSSPSRRRPLRQ